MDSYPSKSLSGQSAFMIEYYSGIALPGLICGLLLPVVIGINAYPYALAFYVTSQHDLLYWGLWTPIWGILTHDGATNGKDMMILIHTTLPLITYLFTSLILSQIMLGISFITDFITDNFKSVATSIVACSVALPLWFRYVDRPWERIATAYSSYRTFDNRIQLFKYRQIMKGWAGVKYIWSILVLSLWQEVRSKWIRSNEGRQQRYLDTLPLHSYSKLINSGYIRLLLLHKRSFLGPIECKLRCVRLSKEVEFEALSYTWGESTPSRGIIVDGCRFVTSSSVHRILSQRSSFWRTRLIWIDSVCINQKDVEEKSAQVSMMRDIYSNADRVLVCLSSGKEASDASLVLGILGELDMLRLWYDPSVLGQKLLERYILERNSPRWQALLDFFDNPYWKRIWIVQEIAVARRVEVIYGGRYIPWNILLDVMQIFSKAEAESTQLLQATADPSVYRKVPQGPSSASIMAIFRRQIQRGEFRQFAELLESCLSFQATDSRDKVYAVLGLTTADVRRSIKTDYSKLANEVYIDASRYLIDEGTFLEVLPYAGIGFSRSLCHDCLPSWVPDWGAVKEAPSLGQARWDAIMNYCASLDSRVFLQTGADPRNISLEGVHVDQIDKLGSVFLFATDERGASGLGSMIKSIQTWRGEIDFLALGMADTYPTGEPLSGAIWRTLMGNRTMDERPAPAICGEYYGIIGRLQTALSDHNNNAGDIFDEIQNSESLAALAEIFQEHMLPGRSYTQSEMLRALSEAGSFNLAVSGCAYRRRFCVTRQGYVGIVPPGSEVGDDICIFAGSQTPTVLRSHEVGFSATTSITESYALVGECYIHGMMDGERWAAKGDRRFFSLR